MNDKRKYCFFCNKEIIGKKSLEHIIPNSLLGKMGIKENILHGKNSLQYSRIKVPAHSNCNSEFGSRYEEEILKLLEHPHDLISKIDNQNKGTNLRYTASNGELSLVTTWLSKIYYGLFYNDYLKSNKPNYKELCRQIIESENFKLIQNSYQNNYGFFMPSSLFVFETIDDQFDLRTLIDPQLIMIKIKNIVLILCIADGNLTQNYISNSMAIDFRSRLLKEESQNLHFPNHLFALAEITAIRSLIPKQPNVIYTDNEMINLSFSTMVKDPEEFYAIEDNELDIKRNKILQQLGINLKSDA